MRISGSLELIMRNTNTSELFFPVDSRPLFYSDREGIHHPVVNRLAIIDRDRENVLGVVGNDYRLVTKFDADKGRFMGQGILRDNRFCGF